jgi:pyruvate kinase
MFEPVDMATRKTKIICTLGPACWDVDMLVQMLDAGMNVARLNFSHGDHKSHGASLDNLRAALKQRPDKVCAVMLDTKGPEIRTGMLDGDKATFTKGQTLEITNDFEFKGNN